MTGKAIAGGNTAAVIGGIIAAKGRKPDMLRQVRQAKGEGKPAFLGFTLRPIGTAWDTP